MHDSKRTANLLGAAALALTDAAIGDATRVGQVSTSSAAALVTLMDQPGLSVSELGRRVGLTQPAAARMVDALEADNLVKRAPSSISRRLVTVYPTARGKLLAQELLTARNAPLIEVVSALNDNERQSLAELLEKILTQLHSRTGRGQYTCRLCDRQSCIKSASCPIGQAERAQGV